jgi:rhodanese-related sulfurtransferase
MTNATIPPSVSVEQLSSWLRDARLIDVLDVRRQPAFEKNPVLIAGAQRVLPDEIAQWLAGRDTSKPIVAYCVYGHEVSQTAAQRLLDHGFNAMYLSGGISEWQVQGDQTVASDA